MNNPYEKLFLNPDSTDGEIESQYRVLKAQYSEDRFLEGEEGRRGAINLTELEEAYAQIKELRARPQSDDSAGTGDVLDEIDALIKQDKLDDAQYRLDSLTSRSGRWHYLQSIIYYKRNWYTDSLRQLDIAISLDPSNDQYRKSRDILQRNMGGNVPPQNLGGAQQTPPPYNEAPQGDDAMGMANCCQAICCMDCCCNLMRCMSCG